eukprot:1159290-Pelagomonas_calceolata.AAC.1
MQEHTSTCAHQYISTWPSLQLACRASSVCLVTTDTVAAAAAAAAAASTPALNHPCEEHTEPALMHYLLTLSPGLYTLKPPHLVKSMRSRRWCAWGGRLSCHFAAPPTPFTGATAIQVATTAAAAAVVAAAGATFAATAEHNVTRGHTGTAAAAVAAAAAAAATGNSSAINQLSSTLRDRSQCSPALATAAAAVQPRAVAAPLSAGPPGPSSSGGRRRCMPQVLLLDEVAGAHDATGCCV